jgi:tetratricopeptide (TPR) repeat protein
MEKLKKIPKLISYLIFQWKASRQLDRLWASKQHIEMISLCNIMISKSSIDYVAFYHRGLANEELHLYAEAIEDFKKSSEALASYRLKSKWYLTKIPIQISRVYRKLQDRENAFDYADKAVQVDNKGINGLTWRASLKEDYGDNIGALEDLNLALSRRPKDKATLKMRNRLTYYVTEMQKYMASR